MMKKTNKKTSTKKTKSNDTVVKQKKKKKIKKILKLLLNIFLLLLLIGLIGGIVFAVYIVVKAPNFDPKNLYSTEASIVYDKNGKQITKLGVEKRKNVNYDDLPQVLVDAIIATEDSRFMQHNGFDLPRFLKASAGQVVNKITGHGNAGGGSTLTMQVSKNNYTSVESSGFEGIVRKFTDIYISIFKLEKNYSKEEIIEFYVNIPYLGNNSYGVEQACQSYFGKSVSDINLSEASLIAGLFQAPASYDPYRHPDYAEERRNTVLYLMQRHGYITKEEAEDAKKISVTSLLRSSNPESESNEYQSYIDVVIDEVEEKTGNNPYTTGMKIYTNLDTDKQTVLNDLMSGKTWTWKDDKVQAGVAIVDVNTGALVAVGGGRNRTGARQLNYATDITRQIGSCAKPLFDYGPAFEYNNAGLASQVYDGPHSYSSGVAIRNVDGSYGGTMTYKYALAASRNIPALKVFQSVDNSKIKEFVTKLGITPEIDSNGGLHEAHALGAFTGSNPKSMAAAYAAFANGGYYAEPYTINKVEYIDSDKTVSLKSKRTRVMSDSTAYMITDALTYAVSSYGNIGGSVSGVQLAAKTGTTMFDETARKKYGYPSSANMDMWVTGYTPEYAVSLWYGYTEAEKGYYLGSEGYSVRGKIFRQIISGISDKSGSKKFTVPSSVVKVTVEKETSPLMLPSANTPDNMKVTEYFKKGTQPTEVSQRYAKLPAVTNLKSTKEGNNYKLTWNFKTPDILDSAYLSKYFSNSVYGNQSANYLQARLDYNNNTLGGFGFGIYKKTSTGNLELIDFIDSKSTEYTYKPTSNGSVDIIVRAEYKNFKDNASDETKITISANNVKELEISLSGNESISVTKGNYNEKGIIVKYNDKNVTLLSDITYTLNNTTYKSKSELEDEINRLEADKEVEITYSATYNKITKTITRKIKIEE